MSGCRASTPAPKRYGYPRSHRLTRESDLEQVKRAGRRLRTEHLDVRAIDSLLSHARVAVVVGKHGHTIVERNRLRRRLRELARTRIIPVCTGTDLVIRSLVSAYGASFEQLKTEMENIGTRLGPVSS